GTGDKRFGFVHGAEEDAGGDGDDEAGREQHEGPQAIMFGVEKALHVTLLRRRAARRARRPAWRRTAAASRVPGKGSRPASRRRSAPWRDRRREGRVRIAWSDTSSVFADGYGLADQQRG